MGEHVGQPDERDFALDVGVVVALDGGRDRARQAPATDQHPAHERVVDAQLAPLLMDALLGGSRRAMHLRGIARVGVQQHELADIVQEARHAQPVTVLVADLRGEAIGGVLGRERVQAKALWCGLPHARALKEVECPHPPGERLHRPLAEELDRTDDGVDAPALVLDLIGEAKHGDDQRDVGLDGADDVGGRGVLLADERQQPIARLGQRGKRLERFERAGQAPAVARIVSRPGDRRRQGRGQSVARPALGAGRCTIPRGRPFPRAWLVFFSARRILGSYRQGSANS